MSTMKDAYTRNISVIDHTDGSGDVIARTSVATLAEDLVFLFDAKPDDEDCPKGYGACIGLAEAYAQGEPCDAYESCLGVELRRD